MKKCWNKSAGSADIFIYGDIVNYDWFDSDVTAKKFADDLNAYEGKPVTVHINSGGGDVFAGLAIYNTLKNYKGDVTISVDGLAASAASLIAMGGKKITMANNSLMMIHEPSVGLFGFLGAADLAKIQNQLAAVHGAIIQTYKNRLGESDIESMVEAETWFNAQEALDVGLIDEITGEVDLHVDDAQKLLFVNKLSVSTKNFDVAKMRRAMGVKNMEIKDEQGFFDKLKAAITDAVTPKDETPKPAQPAETTDAATIREQELTRIRDLHALKCGNAAVDAIVDVAIKDGRAVSDIKPFVDAVKGIKVATAQATADKIIAAIKDQMTSGAEGVQGGQQEQTAEDVKAAQKQLIADFANKLI